jgi:hypothetical protein
MLMIEYIDSNSGERCLRRKSVNIPLGSSDERSLAEVSAGSYRRTSVSVRLTGAAHSHGLLFFVKIIICKNKKILAMECVHCKDFFDDLFCAYIFHGIQNGHIFRRNVKVKLRILDDARFVRGLR